MTLQNETIQSLNGVFLLMIADVFAVVAKIFLPVGDLLLFIENIFALIQNIFPRIAVRRSAHNRAEPRANWGRYPAGSKPR